MNPKERIVSYFTACTEGTADEIAAQFTSDATVYDVNHGPIKGAATIGAFWVKIREKWQGAAWRGDTFVVEANRAAIEWTMTGKSEGIPFWVRGSEHYLFANGQIAEIRQYWKFDVTKPCSELIGFPYGSDERFELP